jgi:hypothetical protein
MSRSEYSDDFDFDNLASGRWRAQVASAIRGARGQAFLCELVVALDALPEKKLIAHALESNGNVCAIGSVGLLRGLDMSKLDPDDSGPIADAFGIADQLVREIEYMNDEAFSATNETRWERMRAWAVAHIKPVNAGAA